MNWEIHRATHRAIICQSSSRDCHIMDHVATYQRATLLGTSPCPCLDFHKLSKCPGTFQKMALLSLMEGSAVDRMKKFTKGPKSSASRKFLPKSWTRTLKGGIHKQGANSRPKCYGLLSRECVPILGNVQAGQQPVCGCPQEPAPGLVKPHFSSQSLWTSPDQHQTAAWCSSQGHSQYGLSSYSWCFWISDSSSWFRLCVSTSWSYHRVHEPSRGRSEDF